MLTEHIIKLDCAFSLSLVFAGVSLETEISVLMRLPGSVYVQCSTCMPLCMCVCVSMDYRL